jgi:hypothetical protein
LKRRKKPKIVIPPHVKGTVGEYAGLFGGGQLLVQGHGIVIGLGDNGSAEVPAHLRRTLTKYLLKHNIGSPRWGTEDIPPDLVLSDKDTSVVLVGGAVPHGAPVGTRFDVFVTSIPQTQTRSLDGGRLMPLELRLAFRGISQVDKLTSIWANAGGAVFVNPFIDPTRRSESAKQLTGRVIGGGKVVRDRPLRLQLYRPDYQMADLIQRRINERFSSEQKIAVAKNRSIVELKIPQDYRDDYEHFLSLVRHLPVRTRSGGWEGRIRQIATQMEMPTANHNALALIWEAMGRQVVPVIQGLYASENPAAAFYAGRTGLRLGDRLADEVIVRFAAGANSPYQIPAIEELARQKGNVRAAATLRKLVDDSNDRVRIAAYEALLEQGDRMVVRRIDVGGEFMLDLVASARTYAVYVTQTKEPKIVLFGKDMKVVCPVFFESPDELVTVNALSDSEKLTVFRKIPRTTTMSEPFEVAPYVRLLVETLGSRPEMDDDGKIAGLGLTYSQVVGVLYRMCKEGDIPAKFVLQETPDMQKIYRAVGTAGRPDMSDL